MRKRHTAKSNARGSDDASLNDGVLLPGKGLFEETRLVEEFGPNLEEEETQKSGGDVEGRDDTGGEVELHHYEGEENAQNEAHHESPHRQLVPP